VRPLTQDGVVSLGQEVGRLTRLVDDLRTLSLSDLGALTYRRTPQVLDDLVDDALYAARPAIESEALDVACQLEPDIVVDVDADRLAQVFANLMQNTLRYTEPPARLQIELRREGNEARIVWQDSPPGVPEGDLERLTDRLFRVDGSRARASGGSGLGLAIARAIVEAHGGWMRASASPIGGLRWEIGLPLSQPGAAHA